MSSFTTSGDSWAKLFRPAYPAPKSSTAIPKAQVFQGADARVESLDRLERSAFGHFEDDSIRGGEERVVALEEVGIREARGMEVHEERRALGQGSEGTPDPVADRGLHLEHASGMLGRVEERAGMRDSNMVGSDEGLVAEQAAIRGANDRLEREPEVGNHGIERLDRGSVLPARRAGLLGLRSGRPTRFDGRFEAGDQVLDRAGLREKAKDPGFVDRANRGVETRLTAQDDPNRLRPLPGYVCEELRARHLRHPLV